MIPVVDVVLDWVAGCLWDAGFLQACIWVGKRSGLFARRDAVNRIERNAECVRSGWR